MRSRLLPIAVFLIAATGCSRDGGVVREARRLLRNGDLGPALAEARRAAAICRAEPRSAPCWEARAIEAEVLIASGKPKDALSLLERFPEKCCGAGLDARVRMNRGHARFQLAQYEEARRLLDSALELAAGTGVAELVAEVELRRGSALVRLERPAEAERSYRRALRLAESGGDVFLRAAAMGNLGYLRMNSSRLDEAVPWFERVLAISEKAGARKLVASTLGNLGRCYYELGDADRAIGLLIRAERMAAEVGDDFGRGLWLGALGKAFYDRREFARAIEYQQKALDLARRVGDAYAIVEWLNSLTRIALDAGELARAESFNREAVALAGREPLAHGRVWALVRSGEIAAARGEEAAALRLYREVLAALPASQQGAGWEAHAGLAAVWRRQGRRRDAEAEFRRALEDVEEARSHLERTEWKLSFQSASARFYDDYVDFLVDSGNSAQALAVAESSRARLLAAKLRLAGPAVPLTRPGRLREVSRAAGATLVSYWLGPRRSHAWVVEGGPPAHFELPAENEIAALVSAFNGSILALRDPAESANESGRRLSDILLAPVAKFAGNGTRFLLVPDGVLHELNFETLPAPSGRRYWLEDATIAIAPSLALPPATRVGAGPGSESLLVIGDPQPPAGSFGRLPEAADEIAAIRQAFAASPQQVFAGAGAVPGAYRAAQPARFSLIHFSAHAVANRESPLDSAVILSGPPEAHKLYARDVLELPLSARIVTISSCRGAGARLYSGEGLVGFAWAFLQAGARNVVAGLWDVSDRSTAALVRSFYAALAGGSGPANALRAAKLELCRSASGWRKPYYWGAFQLYSRSHPF